MSSNPPIHDGDQVTVSLTDSTVPTPEPEIKYTVKELVARIDVKVDGLYAKLDSKVDLVEFEKVKVTVEDLQQVKWRAYGAIAMIAAGTAFNTGFAHHFFG